MSFWRRWLGAAAPDIPERLWRATHARYPFLAQHLARPGAASAGPGADPDAADRRLRRLAQHFLAQKQFQGAHGLTVSDAMAVAVAAQACLPLLHWGRPEAPETALAWYDDFVGVILTPGQVRAQRTAVDAAGVVHHYAQVLSGEAMERGPVLLSWSDVRRAGASASAGYNVVIHEFAHKIDMRGGQPDGYPPLPRGFRGTDSARAAHAAWGAVIEPAYTEFREAVIRAERFGEPAPWLDAYGAESLAEFFPVACEAYFVQHPRFAAEWPALAALFDAYFGLRA